MNELVFGFGSVTLTGKVESTRGALVLDHRPQHGKMAAKHHPDLIMCRKQPGVGIELKYIKGHINLFLDSGWKAL